MLSVLFMVFLGWLLTFFGFDNLIGLESTSYYLAFAVFGAVIHVAQLLKR